MQSLVKKTAKKITKFNQQIQMRYVAPKLQSILRDVIINYAILKI
jgi:hypothetical protein